MPRTPTWPVAAASLVVGFAVADLTGVRPLGGVVLVAAVAWCLAQWRGRISPAGCTALVVLYAGGFAASHVLADVLGTWGAVLAVAGLIAAAVRAVADVDRPVRAGA